MLNNYQKAETVTKALEEANPLLLVDLLNSGQLPQLLTERVNAYNLELARMTPGRENAHSLEVEEALLPMLTEFPPPAPQGRPLTAQERQQVDQALEQWAETFPEPYEVITSPA